jgi:HlyD family secretion protein
VPQFEQAEAVAVNARAELARSNALFAGGVIAREELERSERDAQVAEARIREVRERFKFVNATAREEDVARAEATIRVSEAQVKEAGARIVEARARRDEANARLDKSFIRSPIAGVVLRKRLRIGESVSPESPNNSIFTVADTSALRVRVDVDERDVGGIGVGQRAYVTAETYGERKFTGRVVSVGQILGRKNVRTEEPTERVDKKILETLVELDAGQRLPPGLRVDAFIVINEMETTRAALEVKPRD